MYNDPVTHVKICGLTNLSDALLAIEAGADALGFIAVEGTGRYVSPATFARIRAALPPFVTLVVVVRNASDAAAYPADRVQFYEGDAPTGVPAIRAIRVKDETSLEGMAARMQGVSGVLLDAYHKSALGGAGTVFDWTLAVRARELLGGVPLILAGGLNPANVEEAVRLVRPYAVDVSSGVEAEIGRKDPQKLRAFIQTVRRVPVSGAQPGT
jgi:phosphoribosylanthranilate isomerase